MESANRPQPASTRSLAIGALLGWLVIAAIFIVMAWRRITTLDFDDGDDQLRLVQVRDLIGGQGWFDLHQYRIDPAGGGVLMHWSRLVDLPLALTFRLFAPLLGADMAERVMLVGVPMFTLGIALLLIGRLARRLLDLEIAAVAWVIIALAPPFVTQFMPLRIDHHGWQIVAVLAALNGLVARSAARGGWIAGTALALGMSVSLELLPIVALFGLVLGLRWLEDRGEGPALVNFSAALALASGASFLLTHGTADLAAHCDTVSPPYLAGFAAIAVGVALLWKWQPQRWPVLLAALGVIALAAVANVLALAPNCARGPFAALDPLVQRFWYENVFEGRPVWHQRPAVLLQMTVPPLVALVAALQLWRASEGGLRRVWRDYALVLGGLLVLGILVARSSAFTIAVGVIPLAWRLRDWLCKMAATRALLVRLKYSAAALVTLIPGMLVLLLVAANPAKSDRQATRDPMRVCDLQLAARQLSALPKATLLAPLDMGPALLAFSPHAVVATPHHRAPAAMHDVIAAFIGTPEEAQRIALAHGARYVVFCPALPEVANYNAAAPQGLAARLMRGEVPAWLRPVTVDAETGMKVWEILPAA